MFCGRDREWVTKHHFTCPLGVARNLRHHVPPDSQAWKQPKTWETRSWKEWKDCADPLFFELGNLLSGDDDEEDCLLIYFKNREGGMTSNMLRKCVLRRWCNAYLALVEELRAYLLIPENEKLEVRWGLQRMSLEDAKLSGKWNEVRNIVPTDPRVLSDWSKLKTIEIICCQVSEDLQMRGCRGGINKQC